MADAARRGGPLLDELLTLTPQERLNVAQALWQSVEADEELQYVPIPSWQREILDQRLAEHDRDSKASGRPWEEIKKELWPDL